MAYPLYPRPRFPTPLELATGAMAVQEAYDKTKRVADVMGDIGSTIMDYTIKPLSKKDQAKINRRVGTFQRHLRGSGRTLRSSRRKKSILVNKRMPTPKQKKALVRYAKNLKTTKPKRKTNLTKQVKEIKKSLKADQAYHTFKISASADIDASVASCQHGTFSYANVSNLQTAMANFRYYNPSVPGTLTTADASTGTYSRLVHCVGITNSVTLRNNYQVPCKYRIYQVTPKSDTNIAPVTYYTNGITDQVASAGADSTTPQIYLTDIDVFTAQWKAKVLKSGILEAGRQVTATYNTKGFDFDPSVFDSHTVDWQPKYGCSVFVIRIEGVLGHDTVQDEQTTLQASVDIEGTRIYKFIYDAGTNLNDIYITDSRDQSFTTSGVVSNKAVADNQQYSAT